MSKLVSNGCRYSLVSEAVQCQASPPVWQPKSPARISAFQVASGPEGTKTADASFVRPARRRRSRDWYAASGSCRHSSRTAVPGTIYASDDIISRRGPGNGVTACPFWNIVCGASPVQAVAVSGRGRRGGLGYTRRALQVESCTECNWRGTPHSDLIHGRHGVCGRKGGQLCGKRACFVLYTVVVERRVAGE